MSDTRLTDPKLAAAATVLGGRLQRVFEDPASGRLTFVFTGLAAGFVEGIFNGDLTVNLRDYLAALEQAYSLIAARRAQRGQQPRRGEGR